MHPSKNKPAPWPLLSPPIPGMIGVSVIEAAPAVEVGAAGHHVLTLRLVPDRDPSGLVVPITYARGDEHAVDRVAGGRQHESGRVCLVVGGRLGTAPGCFCKVVAFRGLVIDDRDSAGRAGAEASPPVPELPPVFPVVPDAPPQPARTPPSATVKSRAHFKMGVTLRRCPRAGAKRA
jgi:hypothetical protein